MFDPKEVLGFHIVVCLTAVAFFGTYGVTGAWINHQLELRALVRPDIDELQGMLEMDVIVGGTVN